jgi:chorismate-pyruvate lyase
LDAFHRREQRPLPRIDLITGEAMPEPYRSLLVHDRDMTPTLEKHHGCDIHIEVWGRERTGSDYWREVVLRLDHNQQPVEFGANRINLDLFSRHERQLILDEYLPLGRILNQHKLPHSGGPTAFLRIEADDLMGRAFGIQAGAVLYGRRNTIVDPEGRSLSEIVEILPPAAAG